MKITQRFIVSLESVPYRAAEAEAIEWMDSMTKKIDGKVQQEMIIIDQWSVEASISFGFDE